VLTLTGTADFNWACALQFGQSLEWLNTNNQHVMSDVEWDEQWNQMTRNSAQPTSVATLIVIKIAINILPKPVSDATKTESMWAWQCVC